jgi:hypothetical protein
MKDCTGQERTPNRTFLVDSKKRIEEHFDLNLEDYQTLLYLLLSLEMVSYLNLKNSNPLWKNPEGICKLKHPCIILT